MVDPTQMGDGQLCKEATKMLVRLYDAVTIDHQRQVGRIEAEAEPLVREIKRRGLAF